MDLWYTSNFHCPFFYINYHNWLFALLSPSVTVKKVNVFKKAIVVLIRNILLSVQFWLFFSVVRRRLICLRPFQFLELTVQSTRRKSRNPKGGRKSRKEVEGEKVRNPGTRVLVELLWRGRKAGSRRESTKQSWLAKNKIYMWKKNQ